MGLSEDDKCECGRVGDDKHIYENPNFAGTCSKDDVDKINDNAIKLAAYWADKI